MRYRTLGQTGMRVSELCLGTLTFGGDADPKEAAAIFHRCREAGINFIDTADCYADGRSEEILGGLLEGCRSDVILASKVFYPLGPDYSAMGLSRKYILSAVDASLRRLRTDYIDLYYAHSFDPKTPIEETLEALDDLVRQGKIRFPAVSNWSAWQISKSLGLSRDQGWSGFTCVQPMYGLLKRQAEVEILPLAQSERIAVVPYGALGGGALTGKYSGGKKPPKGRLIQNANYAKRYSDPVNYEIADRFVAYAAEKGIPPAALGVAWVRSHPAVTATLIGARTAEQVDSQLKAASLTLTPDMRAEIAALSPAPPPATDRSEEATSDRPSAAAEPRAPEAPRRGLRDAPRGLTSGQLREFEQKGIVGPLDLCSSEEMRELWGRIHADVLKEDPGHMRNGGSIQWHDAGPRLRSLYDLCTRPALLDPVSSILGNNLILWRSRFIIKQPGTAEIPWHQDLHYFEERLDPVLTVSLWVALEDADRENGCVRLIPGSHLRKVRHTASPSEVNPDFPMRADPSEIDDTWARYMEMRAGQFLIFDQAMVHGSAENRSTRSRAAFSMRITTPLVHLKPPTKDFPILVRGVDRYKLNRVARPLT